jgi:hypothetical protein
MTSPEKPFVGSTGAAGQTGSDDSDAWTAVDVAARDLFRRTTTDYSRFLLDAERNVTECRRRIVDRTHASTHEIATALDEFLAAVRRQEKDPASSNRAARQRYAARVATEQTNVAADLSDILASLSAQQSELARRLSARHADAIKEYFDKTSEARKAILADDVQAWLSGRPARQPVEGGPLEGRLTATVARRQPNTQA